MGSAILRLSQDAFFQLFGLKDFDGDIMEIQIDDNCDILIKVLGQDDRLPDNLDYPECHLVTKTIISHLEEIT